MILSQNYHVDLWGGGVKKAKTPHIVCGHPHMTGKDRFSSKTVKRSRFV